MARNTTTHLRTTLAITLVAVCATTVLTATPGTAQTVPDGSTDSTFTVTTDDTVNWVNAIAVMESGKIVIGGNFGVKRLNTNGTDDSSFTRIDLDAPNSDSQNVQSIVRRGTKILVGGEKLCWPERGCGGIFRFDTDGLFDDTFRPNRDDFVNGSEAIGNVYSIAWRPADGSVGSRDQILYGGSGRSNWMTYAVPILRCNFSGGSECNTKWEDTKPEDDGARIDVVAVMASGRIVVGGDFDGGIKRLGAVKSGLGGSTTQIDDTFSPPAALGTGMVTSIVQTGSKILVGGSFDGRIKRLTESGSEDTSFTPPTLNGDVYAIAVQGDGKILVGGSFDGKIKRLNSDGSTDGTFVPPTLDNSVRTIALQDDGKILIGGDFVGGIKRLNNPSQSSSDSRSGTILGGGGDSSSNAVWIIVIAAAGLAVIAAGVGIARRRKPANS